MQRHIFNPIHIDTYRTDFIECIPESNSFFELVFVEEGKGFRIIDGNNIPFKKNDFFIHLPNEKTFIELEGASVIHFIKFQKVFFLQNKADDGFSHSDWFSGIEFILNSNQLHQETILKNDEEIEKVESLMKVLLSEFNNKGNCDDTNIRSLVIVLLNIAIRNIFSNDLENDSKVRDSQIQDILNYIHLHICENEKLTVSKLAEQFHISKNYFSAYFLNKTGTKLKQYILGYKIKAAQTKLNYTDLNLSQIAFEFGFSDLSHFNKTYKNIMGFYPREERGNP